MSDEAERQRLRLADAHFAAGRYAVAAPLYAAIVADNPEQTRGLLFLGAIHLNDGQLDAAKALFERALASEPGGPLASLALHHLGGIEQRRGNDTAAVSRFTRGLALKSDFAPTHNDLGVSLQRLGRNREAIVAFEQAMELDPAYVAALRNCGLVLARIGETRKAAAVFERLTTLTPDSSEAFVHLGLAHLKLENFAEAETLFQRALALDPANIDIRHHLGEALDGCHRFKEAQRELDEWVRRTGIVVKRCTGGAAKARILALAGADLCNTPTKFLFGADRFDMTTLYLRDPITGEDEPRQPLPDFDLIFNAISDPDRGARFLGTAEALCDRFDRPVLNSPQRIPATRRDRIGSAFADIRGLTVPQARRMRCTTLIAALADDGFFAQPFLIRPVGSHGGRDLQKIDEPCALSAYLEATPADEYYVNEFCDYRSRDGYYRKYRFIFVDRAVYPYHLAIARDWMVHYWRAEMERSDFKREEEAFLADYAGTFPGPLGDAIAAVAQRLDLDYAGLDCSIAADGRVILFEANASMLVQLDEPQEDFPYKYTYVPRIFAAIDSLVARKLAGPRNHASAARRV